MKFRSYKVVVEVEIFVDAESQPDTPYFGINAIADSYAKMATQYKSIGANAADVVSITECDEK